MFNVSVNDKKNIYRSKPVMNVDTVPKPLTYDYMPEGYPKKGIGPVTLMEEQEVSPFTDAGGGTMGATSPVVLELADGDKLTVVWDGVSYDAVVTMFQGQFPVFGNLGLASMGDVTDYPFLYFNAGTPTWGTADTAASHTIKVMCQQVTYTPMDANYIPEGYPNEARVTEMINTALGVIENGSY